jgi:hypothetical protein
MDREQVREWRRGFELAAEVDRRARAELTPLQRLRQLAALMRMSRQLKLGPTYTPAEMESARRNWMKLKAAYRRRHESS